MWAKASNRMARTVWQVEKITPLYCKAALETRKRQHLQYYYIENQRRHLVSYQNKILIYCPALGKC